MAGINDYIARWTFDTADISGTTVYDKSSNHYDATLVGSPSIVTGKIGQAITTAAGNTNEVFIHATPTPGTFPPSTTGINLYRSLIANGGAGPWKLVASNANILTQLIATGAAVAAAAAQKNPQVQAEYKLLLKDSPNFIGVRKGETALLTKVNEILRAAKADGTLEKYAQKWLGRGTGVLPE